MIDAGRKTAIVTGACGGIGSVLSLRLAAGGWRVICTDLDEIGALGEAVAGGAILYRRLDVTDRGAIDALTQDIGEQFGIDLVVNNAATIHFAAIEKTCDEDWQRVIETNLTGAFRLSRATLPYLRARRGKIVNIASWAGKNGKPMLSAYSAAKAGLIGLTQSLAAELAPDGITVNAVCPGTVADTRMGAGADDRSRALGLPLVADRVSSFPLGRLCTPGDVAGVVEFLASSAADYMTGQAINVSGGAVVH